MIFPDFQVKGRYTERGVDLHFQMKNDLVWHGRREPFIYSECMPYI